MKIVIPMMGMGRSGGERVLAKLANYLADKGEDVFIIAPETNCSPYYPLDIRVKILKSKVKKTKSKIINLIFNIYYLIAKSREVNADVALANYFLTAYVVVMLQKKIKKFYYIQAYEVNFNENFMLKALAFISYLLPLKKVVNSNLLLPDLINNYEEVLPPGIDLDLFNRTYTKKLNGNVNIGFVGRKEIYKGSSEIVDVLSSIDFDSKIDVTFHIAVYIDSCWRDKLDNVVYHDINNDMDLAEFYKLNDLIIATGLIEDGAFHYPCAEAIAANCVVISNYAPLSKSQSQFFMKTFSKHELKTKIEKFLSLSQSDIEREIKYNYNIVKDSGWNSVGEKFLRIISKN